MVDGFARDVSEVKAQAATETNHRDAVDFHQVQVGVAAAQEEAGHAAGGAGLIERHAGKVAQQVHRKGLIARPHAAAGNHIHAGGLQAGGDFDGGSDHLHGIDARGDFELHAGCLIERQGAGGKAGRGYYQPRVKGITGFGNVQLETAVGGGGGLCHYADAVDGGDLRAGNRGPGWVDDFAFDPGGREECGTGQVEGQPGWNVT